VPFPPPTPPDPWEHVEDFCRHLNVKSAILLALWVLFMVWTLWGTLSDGFALLATPLASNVPERDTPMTAEMIGQRENTLFWAVTAIALGLIGVSLAVLTYDATAKHADRNYPAGYERAQQAAVDSLTSIRGTGPAISAGQMGYATPEIAKEMERRTSPDPTIRRPGDTEASFQDFRKKITDAGQMVHLAGPVCVMGLRDGYAQLRIDSAGTFNGRIFFAHNGPTGFRPAPETATCQGNAFSSASPTVQAAPGLPGGSAATVVICLFVAIVFLIWHFWGTRAAGVPNRRAFLWSQKQHKWLFDDDTGTWQRILHRSVSGGHIVQTKPVRAKRIVAETTLYRFAAILTPIAMILWIVTTSLATSFYDSDHNDHPGTVMLIYLLQLFIIVPLTIDLLYMMGMQGAWWAMVIDPPPQQTPTTEFGPQSITTAPDHPAQDDLTYNPTA